MKRGISTFAATLIVMGLAITAGVVVYAYTLGMAEFPHDVKVEGYVVGYQYELYKPVNSYLTLQIAKSSGGEAFFSVVVPSSVDYTPHIGDYVTATVRNPGRDNITLEIIITYGGG